MPTSDGEFKGIGVPKVPWHEVREKPVEEKAAEPFRCANETKVGTPEPRCKKQCPSCAIWLSREGSSGG